MIVSGVLSQDEPFAHRFQHDSAVERMMVLVAITRRCGMFEYLAVCRAKGRAQPWLSGDAVGRDRLPVGLLDNVTTVLLVAPVTLVIARYLETPAYPFVRRGVRSNVGGTATLIGDPPNIIIGSPHISASTTSCHLAPVIIAVMASSWSPRT